MNHKNILFVGLGGCAGKIVSNIKKELSPYNQSHNLHYLLIDLERFFHIDNPNVEENEYLFYGGYNPRQFVNETEKKGTSSEQYKELNTYFPIDQHLFKESLPDRPIEKGAGRKRMVGRMLLYANKQIVENKVNELIRTLDANERSSQPNVVVISSCCGGTGSSIFYDILNLFSAKSINLFPVLIGPSFLVEKNKETNIHLANKIKMNAMAFFEELNFYNRFPNRNFSFFGNKATNLNLRYVIFFDNLLSETARIAKDNLKDFENYISKCVALLFSGEYRDQSGSTQDIWANIANIEDDMLNEMKRIESVASNDLLETSNFISFGFYENPKTDAYLLDILKTLIDENEQIELSEKCTHTDILKVVDSDRFKEKIDDAWKDLERVFKSVATRPTPQDIFNKYVDGVVENKFSQSDKIVVLEAINKYYTELNPKIQGGNQSVPVQTESVEEPSQKKGILNTVSSFFKNIKIPAWLKNFNSEDEDEDEDDIETQSNQNTEGTEISKPKSIQGEATI